MLAEHTVYVLTGKCNERFSSKPPEFVHMILRLFQIEIDQSN